MTYVMQPDNNYNWQVVVAPQTMQDGLGNSIDVSAQALGSFNFCTVNCPQSFLLESNVLPPNPCDKYLWTFVPS